MSKRHVSQAPPGLDNEGGQFKTSIVDGMKFLYHSGYRDKNTVNRLLRLAEMGEEVQNLQRLIYRHPEFVLRQIDRMRGKLNLM
jgi:hypothetical protein